VTQVIEPTAHVHTDLIVFDHRVELAVAGVDQVGATSTLAGPPYDTQIGYVPLGVVTIIVPFNWPLAILAASLPQALLAGATVVVKPPPSAPLATTRVVQRVAAALPPGVLNAVTGEDAEIGTALVSDERVANVCFTGSPAGGRRIMAMAAETPATRSSTRTGRRGCPCRRRCWRVTGRGLGRGPSICGCWCRRWWCGRSRQLLAPVFRLPFRPRRSAETRKKMPPSRA
jgi:hypothetical protein